VHAVTKTTKDDARELAVGVDLGGTKILAAVVADSGEVLARDKMRTRVERGASEVLERIAKCIRKAMEKSPIGEEKILAVGIGAPGPLNPDTGVLEAPPNLTGWKNVPLKAVLEERLGMQVFVENDVNVGTWGEYRKGAGVGVNDLVGIFIGTGIGGGLILNGSLYRGFNKTAGEVGHITLRPDGPECGCGKRGCYEALAGRLGVVRRIAELAEEKKGKSPILDEAEGDPLAIRSQMLAKGWREGDPCVRKALTEMCEHTGIVIGSLINFLNPELFVLGGGVIGALGDEFIPLIDKYARAHAFENAARNVRICPAMLGDDAGVIGAALLALERRKGPRKPS
jgi:glucokinase